MTSVCIWGVVAMRRVALHRRRNPLQGELGPHSSSIMTFLVFLPTSAWALSIPAYLRIEQARVNLVNFVCIYSLGKVAPRNADGFCLIRWKWNLFWLSVSKSLEPA